MLLIDEIDRADDEFEAFLLEFLADFAITIPELGTIAAAHRPLVVLTSNRTRELHDALKRRCLYHWIDYPTPEREAEIVRTRLPGRARGGRRAGVRARSRRLRERELYKLPGVGETITWARALLALDGTAIAGRHARRRAEGPRGHRPRAPRPGPRGCLTEPRIASGHARDRREGARRTSSRARLARGGRRGARSHRRARCSAEPDDARPSWATHLSAQVAALAAQMRAHGARVGLGEVLAAERALAAVDASDRAPRSSSRCAPRCAPPAPS